MSRGRKATPCAVDKARAAWGGSVPAWVVMLAEACDRSTAARVAGRIGYSPAVISHVIANSYVGDLGRVEGKVRGALMHETVVCPVLGEIGLNRCLDEQRRPFSATSAVRVKLYHRCRGGCPHSRLKTE